MSRVPTLVGYTEYPKASDSHRHAVIVPPIDTSIETFRQTVEHLGVFTVQLHTLAVTVARADELPVLIAARTSYPIERMQLAGEQVAIGHPVGLRIRRVQLESELRQGWIVAIQQQRAATDAVTAQVSTAAHPAGVVGD